MARTLITDVGPLEGPLYTVSGEDELLYVFDTGVIATAQDGSLWQHATFVVKGFVTVDGVPLPNYAYRTQMQAFVEKVRKAGSIDVSYWLPYVEPSFAEREAYNQRCEDEERAGY